MPPCPLRSFCFVGCLSLIQESKGRRQRRAADRWLCQQARPPAWPLRKEKRKVCWQASVFRRTPNSEGRIGGGGKKRATSRLAVAGRKVGWQASALERTLNSEGRIMGRDDQTAKGAKERLGALKRRSSLTCWLVWPLTSPKSATSHLAVVGKSVGRVIGDKRWWD